MAEISCWKGEGGRDKEKRRDRWEERGRKRDREGGRERERIDWE
jgi:hypothetical protein